MAIYHCSVKIISRGIGKSAVAASAYRSGEKIKNEYDGIVHDYTKKRGIIHTEIIAPENAPEWTKNRSRLWNEVELFEKRKDARLSREIEVALPKELSLPEQKELLSNFCKEYFVSEGLIADISIHDKGDGNPHGHIMLTDRQVNESGFLVKKDRKLNAVESLEKWRLGWEKHVNAYPEKNCRISHASHADRGLPFFPTKHLGPYLWALEKRGTKTDRGEFNRTAKETNDMIERFNREAKEYNAEVDRSKKAREEAKAEAAKRAYLPSELEKLVSSIKDTEKEILLLSGEISRLDVDETKRELMRTERILALASKHFAELAEIEKSVLKLGFFDFFEKRALKLRETRERTIWEQAKKILSLKPDFNEGDAERLRARAEALRNEIHLRELNLAFLRKKLDSAEKKKTVYVEKRNLLESHNPKTPEEKDRDRERVRD